MKRVAIAFLYSVGVAVLLTAVPHGFVARVHAQSTPQAGSSSGQVSMLHTREWYEQHTSGGDLKNGVRPFGPTDNLPPGNGDIMPHAHVFLIFWTPNNTIPASYKDLLARFVNDLGNTPFLNIVTQYPANNGAPENAVNLAASVTDTTHPYPHAGTPADPLQDADIRGEVDAMIAANGWPTGLTNFFAVFTEKGIESCFGSDCTPGTPSPVFCAYHFNFTNGTERLYTNMPYVNTWGGSCNNTSGTPNNTDADREVSTFSHELIEAITDPRPNDTWTDFNCGGGVACGEIGDKCAYYFIGGQTAPDGSNLTLHGNPYNIQPEWSNGTFTALGGHANDGCTHAYLPADMDISKTGPGSIFAGATFDYTIDVQSNTSPTAETPHFTDTLNANLQFQAITKPAGWACATPPVGSTGTIDCNRTNNALGDDGSMNAGDTASFTVTSRVSPSVPNGTTISNTGQIAWDGKYAANNAPTSSVHLSKTSATSAIVVTSADLAISKTPQGAAFAGSDFSYIIDVENGGPSDATSVTVTDNLPPGTTFVSVTGSGGFSCSGTGPVTCTKSSMGSGALASFTLTIHIPSSVPNGTIITNNATVSSTTSDPNPGNNSASVSATVNAEADLSISKTGPSAPVAGSNVTYQIAAANLGPSDAQAVAMTDNTPAGTTFVSFVSPAGWTNVTPPVGGTGLVSSSKATLAAGATPPFTLVVHLSPSTPNGTQLCNTAAISTTTLDPNSGNNSSQTCGTVQTSSDLALTQTVTTSGSPGHGTAEFTLTVTNNGPSDSQNITLVATSSLFTGPPPQINVSSGGTCTVGVQTVTCTWASLALGATDVVGIKVQYRSAVGQVCDSATLSSGTPDPNSINNNSTVCISKK